MEVEHEQDTQNDMVASRALVGVLEEKEVAMVRKRAKMDSSC